MCQGEEAGRFAWLLLSPLLAFLGHQEKAPTRRTGGSWGWGVRGAWCTTLPRFICSESLSASLRAPLGKAIAGAVAVGEKRGKGEGRWGQGDKRAKGILPASQGTWSPMHVQGFQRGEWSNQFPDQAIYYQKAAGFSVCPMSLGRGECRQGKGKNWVPFRLRGL